MADETVKVKLLVSVVIGAGKDGEAGEVVELSRSDAATLIGAKQAEAVSEDDENNGNGEDESAPKQGNGRRKKR
jgi:hypothetical protein